MNTVKEIIKIQKKIKKIPPLSKVEEKIVEGELLIDSVYTSARIEGSTLNKEDVKRIIAST